MVSALSWRVSFRIIPSKYPYVGIYDRIISPADIDAVIEIEQLTNPRVRQELGNLSLLRPQDIITGPGSTPIMAAFTNTRRTRFSDGSFGVYYAAHTEATAIAETRFHREAFLRATAQPPADLEMRVYRARIAGQFDDIRDVAQDDALYDPTSYKASQAYGRSVYDGNGDGVVYRSVRDQVRGECVAAFRPRLVKNCIAASYLQYRWDGRAIIDVLRVQSLTGRF